MNTDIMDTAPAKTQPSSPPALRSFGDVSATREAIYNQVFDAAANLPPVSNVNHTLKLSGVEWVDPPTFSKKQHKDAVLQGHSLGRRLRGTWELLDNAGNMLDQKRAVVASVPHLTDNGTFVINGTEYALVNQQRLRAGVFSRQRENGELETHVNVRAHGPAHRYFLDPDKGVFYVRAGQAKIPALPLLQSLGVTEPQLRQAWGDQLYAANYRAADGGSMNKLLDKFLHNKIPEGLKPHEALRQAFEKMELDPEVTKHTMGHPHERLNGETVLAITKKLLAISRGEADTDDRDHLAYQHVVGPEELFRERLLKDRAGVRRQLLFKMSGKGDLKSMPSSALQDQIHSAVMESGLGRAVEETNPAEVLDKNTQLSRMGEGGIGSLDAIPDESRNVLPSQLGFIDAIRTPESEKAGVDTYLAGNVRKGSDGKLYSQFSDPKTGQLVWKHPQELADAVIAFPGAMAQPGKRVPGMQNGRLTWVRKQDVQLVLPSFEYAFSPLNNLVPLKSMLKGQRANMGSRMTTQALPLAAGEAPLVQSGIPGSGGSRSFEEEYAHHMGAVHAKEGGKVVAVDPEGMTVRYDSGKTDRIDLHNQLPFNRRTFLHQTAMATPGQRFASGELLARSNFTDPSGVTALGLNARVAFMAHGGKNFEDAISISESAAKRFASEHAYQHQLEVTDQTKTGKRSYISLFPSKYDKAMLANIGDNGVVTPGTTVHYGDPLILAAEQKSMSANKIHRQGQAAFNDATITWDHRDSGVVTDVVDGKHGPVVVVKSTQPMKIGDKLADRYGSKGVIGNIVPDDQMPHDQAGQPYEVLMNPLGTISRTNPARWIEAKLGDIARRTGQPFKVEDFDPNVPDRVAWMENLMQQHGVPDTEDVIDPVRGNKIPGVYTGTQFFMKLHHLSESKEQGRSGGSYAADETPAKGGPAGSKRLSLMDLNALLSTGATEVLRDAGAIRGQRNEDYWMQFMQGHTPRQPKVPLVYHKFISDLKASGINVVRDGSQMHIMALTDKDVDKLAGDRNVENAETVQFHKNLEPVKGGLFDPTITGGHHSSTWAAIPLAEPMPNPVMEDPIRRVLGLTKQKFEDVLAGKQSINGASGPQAIADALKRINLDRELAVTRAQISGGNKTERDDAVRKLGYLKSAKRLGIHPSDWVLKRVPVLPPQFRPVNVLGTKKIPLVADPNFLYKELFEANRNLSDMKKAAGDEQTGNERLAVYHAFKAVTGLGEPITQQNKERAVKGILQGVFGSSPKFSTLQRKLLSSTVDNVGRAVITPNPDLDMDSVGLPEDSAFDVYQRFIVRRLRRSGMAVHEALQHVRDRTPLARKTLVDEMEHRPVIVNRAPVLHRFGIMAFRPRLIKGSVLQMSPLVVKGFGADFDGDTTQFHVPVDDKAREEALERMLPSRQLLSPADFKTPVHAPGQEYLGGIFLATSKLRQSKRPERVFRNSEDVRKAWLAGEIAINDKVRVLED